MPWCPKCRTEYIEGIEACADCHTPLVASLEDESLSKDSISPDEISGDVFGDDTGTSEEDAVIFDDTDVTDEDGEKPLTQADLARELHKHTTTYVQPEERYKDTKSSGYMLTVIGAAGIIVLVLVAVGVIPLSMDPFMKYIFFAVLGVLFLIFFILGINSLKKSGEYKALILKEKKAGDELLAWLCEDAQKVRIDACHGKEISPEEAYFECQELMRGLILEKAPDIKEEFLNYIIETAYNQMYE